MKEAILVAREELKRIDHLIYVTLKYTRTVDVLKSIVERMITCYEFSIDTLLKMAQNDGKIDEVPEIPILRVKKIQEIFANDIKIMENMDKYILFRKIKRATNYEKRNEFRRHVTMSALIDGKVVEINIDNMTEDYHRIAKFIENMTKNIFEKEN
ncbi:hypothetical protein HOD20_07120 [archaeon]|jgi:hypothetical protein|nr:hypothetical protein [archaeon]MBT4352276.1 hypothetical protein [archaeon]MBT4648477.1 hypothetical protein [archaeon]MBT6821714.1 hypothetical protein [archaeon]MBT7391377.1 hypothetical protein [archaeon]